MSEYAIWAMISLARNTHILMRNQIGGKWDKKVFQGEINGSTVGILGLGSIGQEIARKASLLGMHVIGVKSNPQDVDYVDKVYGEEGMAEVFKESDYVINLLPSTKKTEKIVDMRYFSLMKEKACFINMGRGTTVNENDLIRALQEKKFRAMVSDVFENEPLSEDSPLWKMDNVILTPHICGPSPKYNERSMEIIEHNLKAYLSGGDMINIVDPAKGY
jgi:phosphoglycerate dehydrogenase-like enzyme